MYIIIYIYIYIYQQHNKDVTKTKVDAGIWSLGCRSCPWRTTRCPNKICHDIVYREHPTLQIHNWTVCDASAMLECPHLDFVFEMLKWISIVENNYTMPDNKYSKSQLKCLRRNYTWEMQECPHLDSVLEMLKPISTRCQTIEIPWASMTWVCVFQHASKTFECYTMHNSPQRTEWSAGTSN